ncbi:MAG: hypothetical protein R2762_18135 [Bryobacteraceae bacterium]
MNVQILCALLLTLNLAVGMAAAPVIGVATAKGSFKLDSAPVTGNGTLLDGVTIETSRAASELRLVGGVKMSMGAGSRGQLFRNRMVLERGTSQFSNVGQFGLEAKSLRIVADDANSAGRISVNGDNRVQVAAVSGSFRISNAKGVLLASLRAGHALEFEPQSSGGAAAPSRLTGCVVKKDNQYFLTDDTANVTVQLKGGHIEKYAGHKVEVVGAQIPGAKPEAGASQLVQVSELKDLDRRCSLPAGAIAGGAAAGGAAAGGATAGGVATAAGVAIGTKAVVAGVIVAAAATGTAVGITQAGDDPPAETISQ